MRTSPSSRQNESDDSLPHSAPRHRRRPANFSTFLGKPGLYLEDLYVQPAHRGTGLGKALLHHLGGLAVARGCGRFEWSVLDWNENAIRFYESMGATVLPDWRICRLTGNALQGYARD